MYTFLRSVLPFMLFAACTPAPTATSGASTPSGPGYVMVEIASIDDAAGFGAYSDAASPTLVAHSFLPVAVTPTVERLYGASPEAWTVVIQFSDVEAARGWYDDPDYAAARPLRFASTGTTHFGLAEGLTAAAEVDHTVLHSYLLLHVDAVTDVEAFDDYRESLTAGLLEHGAVKLLDTGETEALEGDSAYGWTVLAGFPSERSMKQWRDSPETAADDLLRTSSSTGASAVVVPAFDPSLFE